MRPSIGSRLAGALAAALALQGPARWLRRGASPRSGSTSAPAPPRSPWPCRGQVGDRRAAGRRARRAGHPTPKVADAVLRSPRRIYVLGLGAGADRRGLLRRRRPPHPVAQHPRRPGLSAPSPRPSTADPAGPHVRVEAVNSSLVLSGEVANAADADKAVQLAQPRSPPSRSRCSTCCSIAGKEQVMLKVRIVEVQRTVIKQLGLQPQRPDRARSACRSIPARTRRHLRRQRRAPRRADRRLSASTPPTSRSCRCPARTGDSTGMLWPSVATAIQRRANYNTATVRDRRRQHRPQPGQGDHRRPSSGSAWCAPWPSRT